MIIKTTSKAGMQQTDRSPEIIVTPEEIAKGTIIKLEIDDQNGKRTIFWLTTKMNNRNQPKVTISTERNGKEVRKEITGIMKPKK